jgi:hypothetical protein
VNETSAAVTVVECNRSGSRVHAFDAHAALLQERVDALRLQVSVFGQRLVLNTRFGSFIAFNDYGECVFPRLEKFKASKAKRAKRVFSEKLKKTFSRKLFFRLISS